MYLTFDRRTRELINYSDTSPYSVICGNRMDIVHYDDYTVTVKRDDVDIIETYFDESLQLNVLVPGQYTLSDAEENFVGLLSYMTSTLDLGKKLIEEKVKIHKDIFPASYVVYMGQLALKNEQEYTEDEKKILFHLEKNDYIVLLNTMMKLFNSIDLLEGNLTKKVKSADTKDLIDLAFNEFKASLSNL